MRRSRFEVYRREDGKWDWRLKAGNGRIIGTSGGQGYGSAYDAQRAVHMVWGSIYMADNYAPVVPS